MKLNPDAAWERRTQSIEVLGRDRSSSAYTTLKARADHTFDPAGNGNGVTIPLTGRVSDVQLEFSHNSAGYGAQVAELEVRGTAAPNPDLTVTTLDWTPAAPTETDPVTVRATVRNAKHRAVRRRHGERQPGGHRRGQRRRRPRTGRHRHRAGERGHPPQGSYTVSAVVDPTDTVPELDETNNSRTASQKLTVAQRPGPDLEVTGIRTSPAAPAVGASVSFTVSVHNRGTSPAPPVRSPGSPSPDAPSTGPRGRSPAPPPRSPSPAPGPPRRDPPSSPPPRTPPAPSPRPTSTTTSSAGRSSSAVAQPSRTPSTRRRTAPTGAPC